MPPRADRRSARSRDGGHIAAIDPGGLTAALFNAPAKFTSIIEANQTLSFDMKINGPTFDNDDPGNPFPDLVPLFYLSNGGSVIVYAVPEPLAQATVGSWAHWSIPLVPNGDPGAGPGAWFGLTGPDDGTGFDNLLGAGAPDPVLRIWGELTKDDPEADGVQLDNVQLSAIPVPAALPLLVSALALLGRHAPASLSEVTQKKKPAHVAGFFLSRREIDRPHCRYVRHDPLPFDAAPPAAQRTPDTFVVMLYFGPNARNTLPGIPHRPYPEPK